jgi:hypothetical protein
MKALQQGNAFVIQFRDTGRAMQAGIAGESSMWPQGAPQAFDRSEKYRTSCCKC